MSQSEVEHNLVQFFSGRLRAHDGEISATTDIKSQFNLSDGLWLSLIDNLLRSPWIAQLKVRPDFVEVRARTRVSDLAKLLCRKIAEAQADLRVTSSRNSLVGRQEADELTIWYGTNRRLLDDRYPSIGFSSERDSRVHFGTCDVRVPKSHKIGHLGSSWLRRVITGIDDRLKIREIKSVLEDFYWQDLRARLAGLDLRERHAVIFVHGYNVSFENAALRAAQIGCDLRLGGLMAFFSWPSKGTVDNYSDDEATIEASEPYITQFLSGFMRKTGATTVHIVAHSMGNRGVLRAISNIAKQAAVGGTFGQVILAAADVDAGTFKNLCGSYVSISLQTTLYVSARDRAIEASRWLHRLCSCRLDSASYDCARD